MADSVQGTKFTGEDVPAMYLRERLFLQDLAVAAGREADMEKQHTRGPLMIAYENLIQAVATVEAFLARQELSERDQKGRSPTERSEERTDG